MRKVKLLSPHTHLGVSYNAGQEIEMDDADAVWYNEAVIGQREQAASIADTPVGRAISEAVSATATAGPTRNIVE